MGKKHAKSRLEEQSLEGSEQVEERKERIQFLRFSVMFKRDGDGAHTVTFESDKWECNCEYFQSHGVCSHTLALERLLEGMVPGPTETNPETAVNWLTLAGVLVPEPDEVVDYLLRHSDLVDLLLLMCKAALERFESGSQLSLEVYHDPEIADAHLALYVRQEEYDEDILEAIEEIWEKYEDRLASRSGWFLITTDFRPPIDEHGLRLERVS